MSLESNGGGSVTIKQDLTVLTSILKLTGSVKMQLIPADLEYLDKKTFDWTIETYSAD